MVERGRKIHEEKKQGETRGYNLTRSPLTAALYYLNVWNRLMEDMNRHEEKMQALRIKGKINLPTFDKMSEAK